MILDVVGALCAALAYVLPGLALVRRSEWERADLVELAAIGCAGSIAWWAVGVWFIGFARLPLDAFAWLSLAGAVALLMVRRHSGVALAWRTWSIERRHAAFGIAFVIAVVASRLLLAFTHLGYSVGDMSAHAYMTELIVMRNGLPDTYEPFVPIGDFGSFPPGLHALSAVHAALGGVPSYRATLYVMAFALAAMTFTLAALLRELGIGRRMAPLAAAGALMIARHPQFFAMWGGAPTLLAAAIVFLVMRDALRLTDETSRPALARLGFLSAGTLLVHQLPVVSFLYVFPALIALRAGRDGVAWKRVLRQGAGVAGIAAALSLPFLLRTPLHVPPAVQQWAREWFRHETDRALRLQSPIFDRLGLDAVAGSVSAHTWPFYLVIFLGVLPLLLLFAGLALGWKRDASAVRFALAMILMHLVMFSGGLLEIVPLWPSLYPTRIGIWLAPALGIALAMLGGEAARRVRPRVLRLALGAWVVLFAVEGWRLSGLTFGTAFYDSAKSGRSPALALVANEAVGGAFWVLTHNDDNAVLTRDDLQVFEWVRRETPAEAVFATNYGDAGNLVTAVAHRRVIAPHFNLQFFYPDEMRRLAEARPEYVLVTSRWNPDYPRAYTAEQLQASPDARLVFRAGDSRVFRLGSRSP